MSFTRTRSGIANSPIFFQSDLIAYIEGKNCDAGMKITPDEIFYKAVIAALTDIRKIKITILGNRDTVLKYANEISGGVIKNSIVFVDRDYEDILISSLPRGGFCMTNGYSWENDFWNELICASTLESISINCPTSEVKEMSRQIRTSKQQLAKISVIDCACHLFWEALLKKNGGACGINFSFNCAEVISKSELARLVGKTKNHPLKKCIVARQVIKQAKLKKPEMLIQGHLWEHVAIALIATRYKKLEGGTIQHKVIKNLALNHFKSDPKRFLGAECALHYQRELKRVLS